MGRWPVHPDARAHPHFPEWWVLVQAVGGTQVGVSASCLNLKAGTAGSGSEWEFDGRAEENQQALQFGYLDGGVTLGLHAWGLTPLLPRDGAGCAGLSEGRREVRGGGPLLRRACASDTCSTSRPGQVRSRSLGPRQWSRGIVLTGLHVPAHL